MIAAVPSQAEFLVYLAGQDILNSDAVERVLQASRSTGQSATALLLDLGLLEDERLAQLQAAFLDISVIAPGHVLESFAEVPNIRQDYLAATGLLPLSANDTQLHLACAHPLDNDALRSVAYFSGLETRVSITTPSEIARLIREQRGEQTPLEQDGTSSSLNDGDIERLRDLASDAPIVRKLSQITARALEQRASDIHFDPLENRLNVRLRVDGVLRQLEILDAQTSLALISRLKILAKLNIAERRLPQDGRIRLIVKGRPIDCRVATSPTVNGEAAVLRILDRVAVKLEFKSIGFAAPDEAKLRQTLNNRDGIILVTGPTGSGKTTTLYAALAALNNAESKIFSIEDPVEYQIEGISQIPVRSQIGLDFASILRSVLRQDPDIIMVGEIRDAETARIAVQASLTGHLVLSTVHTNSAVSAVTRLRDLGIENFLLASSLRAILAQRLVRTTCSSCHGASAQGGSCSTCQGSGYSGRTIVYELLSVTEDLQQAISRGADDAELLSLAREASFITLREHAQSLVASAVTTQAEIMRALGSADP